MFLNQSILMRPLYPSEFMNNSVYNLECKWRWMIPRVSISFNVPSGWVFVILQLLHVITNNLPCCYWKCNGHKFHEKYLSNFIWAITVNIVILWEHADHQTQFFISCWSNGQLLSQNLLLDCLNSSNRGPIILSVRKPLWGGHISFRAALKVLLIIPSYSGTD